MAAEFILGHGTGKEDKGFCPLDRVYKLGLDVCSALLRVRISSARVRVDHFRHCSNRTVCDHRHSDDHALHISYQAWFSVRLHPPQRVAIRARWHQNHHKYCRGLVSWSTHAHSVFTQRNHSLVSCPFSDLGAVGRSTSFRPRTSRCSVDVLHWQSRTSPSHHSPGARGGALPIYCSLRGVAVAVTLSSRAGSGRGEGMGWGVLAAKRARRGLFNGSRPRSSLARFGPQMHKKRAGGRCRARRGELLKEQHEYRVLRRGAERAWGVETGTAAEVARGALSGSVRDTMRGQSVILIAAAEGAAVDEAMGNAEPKPFSLSSSAMPTVEMEKSRGDDMSSPSPSPSPPFRIRHNSNRPHLPKRTGGQNPLLSFPNRPLIQWSDSSMHANATTAAALRHRGQGVGAKGQIDKVKWRAVIRHRPMVCLINA
ncbi:hypothetical protein BJ546DRAFT_949916 [Cryomyces antarcticus]